jgi:hypothetical protein
MQHIVASGDGLAPARVVFEIGGEERKPEPPGTRTMPISLLCLSRYLSCLARAMEIMSARLQTGIWVTR